MEDVSEDTCQKTAQPTEPTMADLYGGVERLVAEIDDAFSSSKWAMVDSGSARN
jgi:hypothetical protein